MIHRATYWSQAMDAASYLQEQGMSPVDVIIQCGSGMSRLAEMVLPEGRRIDIDAIPHFPVSEVKGHGNEAVYGHIGDIDVLFFTGRIHVYEGYDPLTVGFPCAVAKALETKLFIATSAAGGLNQHYHVGDVMVHNSFINFQLDNALIHLETEEYKERFIDPKPPFDPHGSRALSSYLTQTDVDVQQGVYLGVRGPMYETLAELHMYRSFGADAIGMSSIPEYTVAHFFKLPLVGVSIITNEGFRHDLVTHERVLEMTAKALPALGEAIRGFLSDRYLRPKLHRRSQE